MKIYYLSLFFVLTFFSVTKAQIVSDTTEPGRIFFKAIVEKDSTMLINYFQPAYSEIEHLMETMAEMDTLDLNQMKKFLEKPKQKDSLIMFAYNKARKHSKRSYEECINDLEELGIDPSKMILKKIEYEVSKELNGIILELKTYIHIEYDHKFYFIKIADSILLEGKWRGLKYRYVKDTED